MRTVEVEVARWSYEYYWPNGELSHTHWRLQLSSVNQSTGKPNKRYLFQAPDGSWTRPNSYYPLYGDLGLPLNAHVIVTEGEPAADVINAFELNHDGHPIHALTAGSVVDLVAAADILAARLPELQPASITLWPDADEPGIKAMRDVQRLLAQRHVAVNVIKPADLKLENKADAVEFLQGGGDLPAALAALSKPAALLQPRDIAERLIVTSEGVLWPGTERIWKLDQSTCSSLWQKITGRMPADRDAKELLNLLRARQSEDPVLVHWRLYCEPNRVIWRPDPMRDCYEISAEGVSTVADIPTGLLMAPGRSVVPAEASPHGTQEHYQRLCEFFGLSDLEQALILAWLVCCLLGRETPILLMRGLAGTGKSTLAGFLLGLVEPTLREMDLEGQRNFTDHRQLLQTLRQVPALLIDNLTGMSAGMEDVLSRLVTGYSSSVMWKYSNEVEQLRLRRGIIITTTNYDVYKGDLASRIIVCQPRIKGGWVDRDDEINPRFLPLLPMIRGWLFRQAHRVLATRPSRDSSFRVASVGRVLDALGYDAKALAEQEGREKARMLNQNDPWMLAMVDIWDRENEGGEFLLSLGQITDRMYDLGVPRDALPVATSPRFARWVEEKHMLLRDHGFYLERYRDDKMRGYWFRRVKE